MSATDTVADGDTFARVGDDGGPWEVIGNGVCEPWCRLARGEQTAIMRAGDLLDPAKWRRVRAPEFGYVYEVREP